MARILIVDDDQALLRALNIGLTARGYDVIVARAGEPGLVQVSLSQPDVMVLDLGLPDLEGVEVCRRLRQFSDLPVLVLSAVGDEDAKVQALDAGADDYVTKPFGMAELEARLRVALRRHRQGDQTEPDVLQLDRLRFDLVHQSVSLDGNDVNLTSKEFAFLAYLARHPGKLCTHQLLLRAIWGPTYQDQGHYLRVYAHRLRRKLGSAASMLETRPGLGYRLVVEDDARRDIVKTCGCSF